MMRKLWQNDFYKGGLFFTLASFLVHILNYFFNFLVGRSLGPVGYGEIATLFSYSSLFSIPILIISTLIIQKIASSEDDQGALFQSIQAWIQTRIRKWWFLAFIILIITPFISPITNLNPLSASVLVPLVLLSFLFSYYAAYLQGMRLFFAFSIIHVVINVLKLTGALLVTAGVDGLTTVYAFLLLSSITACGLSYLAIKQHIKPRKTVKKIEKRLLSVFTSSYFLMTAATFIALTLYNTIDIIMVKKFYSAYDAGIFSSWSLFGKIIFYLIGPIVPISFVFFASNKHKDSHVKTLFVSLGILVLVAVASFIGYGLLGRTIITILFGSKFLPVVQYLVLSSIFGSLYAAINFLNNFFLAKKNKAAFILPLAMPFYIVALFFTRHHIEDVMRLDIVFSTIVCGLYLFACVLSLLYNRPANEKKD